MCNCFISIELGVLKRTYCVIHRVTSYFDYGVYVGDKLNAPLKAAILAPDLLSFDLTFSTGLSITFCIAYEPKSKYIVFASKNAKIYWTIGHFSIFETALSDILCQPTTTTTIIYRAGAPQLRFVNCSTTHAALIVNADNLGVIYINKYGLIALSMSAIKLSTIAELPMSIVMNKIGDACLLNTWCLEIPDMPQPLIRRKYYDIVYATPYGNCEMWIVIENDPFVAIINRGMFGDDADMQITAVDGAPAGHETHPLLFTFSGGKKMCAHIACIGVRTYGVCFDDGSYMLNPFVNVTTV